MPGNPASHLGQRGTPRRRSVAQSGSSLRADSSLREAVSYLAMHRIESVNLDDGAGSHAGVLHAADIFSQLKLPDSKG